MADIRIPLDEMTLDEKLDALEILWENLIRHPEDVPSPEWHREALASREESFKRGDDHYEDWEVAKANITRAIS